MRYVLINRFAAQSGYSEKAIRRKIEEGVWVQGRQYRRAPDGRIMIDVEGVEKWVEGQLEPSNRSGRASDSSSRSTGRVA